MNKTDFVKKLAQSTDLPNTKALEITNAVLGILQDELNDKGSVQFIGFGTFEVKYASERMARNPRTKEPVLIPARHKAVFKPSGMLLSRLNGGVDNAK